MLNCTEPLFIIVISSSYSFRIRSGTSKCIPLKYIILVHYLCTSVYNSPTWASPKLFIPIVAYIEPCPALILLQRQGPRNVLHFYISDHYWNCECMKTKIKIISFNFLCHTYPKMPLFIVHVAKYMLSAFKYAL